MYAVDGAALESTAAAERPGRTKLAGAIGAILFAAFTVWINYEVKFVHHAMGTVGNLGDLALGAPAPSFSLADLDGAMVSLESLRGNKVVLVEFWATWCPPCRMVLATLRRMEQTLREENVEVLSVNQEETAEQVHQYVARDGTPFRVVLDPDGAVARRYGVTSLPTMVLIDKQGIIRWIHVGHMPETDELRDVLQRVARN
jgi:peroxiredoxin